MKIELDELLDAELKEMFDTGFTYEKMAIHFGRTKLMLRIDKYQVDTMMFL